MEQKYSEHLYLERRQHQRRTSKTTTTRISMMAGQSNKQS